MARVERRCARTRRFTPFPARPSPASLLPSRGSMKTLREDDRPADLWFWSDWLSSVDVRSCSLAAQGLWANMLAVMSRSDRKGFLSINGKPMDSKELAKFVGEHKERVEELLTELEYYQ